METFRRTTARTLRLGAALGVAILAAAGPAHAKVSTAAKCRAAIVKASSAYTTMRAKVLAKCWDKVAAGKPGPCPDALAAQGIQTAGARLANSINKGCGEPGRFCSLPGSGSGESLAAIGWNLGTCASIGDGACSNPITNCTDIATCVGCVNDRAGDQAFALYTSFNPTGSDKRVRSCIRSIIKGGTAASLKVSKALTKCWSDVNKAESGGSFSCPDSTASASIGRAKAKNRKTVCKSCDGANTVCGDGDDVTREAIGFPASCPAVGTCGGPIQTVKHIADCISCVTSVLSDGSARSAIPAFSSGPQQCVPAPTATP